VREWWAKNLDGSSRQLHDQFKVHLGTTAVEFEVVEVVENAKVVWAVTDCYLPWLENQQEWTGTQIVWNLAPRGNSTVIDFTHVGLKPAVECYEGCRKGWDYFLNSSLTRFIQEDKGLPE
jgi:hypothetical protein